MLPPRGADGKRASETQGDLLRKHRQWGLTIGAEAIEKCVRQAGLEPSQIDYLCCVTSTGFMTPGFSARLMADLQMRPDCSRLDVVGMGCNAGLNALGPVAAWSRANPGKLAVMVCIEICSAAYVFDSTMRTSVVNSLFGDGAAAVALKSGGDHALAGPAIVKTSSHIIFEAMEAMRFDWDETFGQFSFFLDPEVPYIVGANVEQAALRLLAGTELRIGDIQHWLIHSGGKKVVDAIRVNLGLSRHDLRNTLSILRDYGNLSSGSFLFSYERLEREGLVHPGDIGIMVTMGPGSTIEMSLLQW